MKLAIVGSRTWTDEIKLGVTVYSFCLNNKIDRLQLTIVSGGANGADKLAEQFAAIWGISTIIHKPDYDQYGRYDAPKIRNQLIVNDCDYLICFWDGKSTGCMDAVDKASKAGKGVTVVRNESTIKILR